jgi:hypothetical protein
LLQSHGESLTNDELRELAEQTNQSKFTASDAEEETPVRELWDLLGNVMTIITQIRDQFIDNKPDYKQSSRARQGTLDKTYCYQQYSTKINQLLTPMS